MRHEFWSHKSCGKSVDANHKGVAVSLHKLSELVKKYRSNDVFNADKFEFYCSESQNCTIGLKSLSAKNNQENI